jgi:hypothetical protein
MVADHQGCGDCTLRVGGWGPLPPVSFTRGDFAEYPRRALRASIEKGRPIQAALCGALFVLVGRSKETTTVAVTSCLGRTAAAGEEPQKQ